uniref:Uncharacterized protein n=1 Tax=Rhizophora mucronata TaxID=61149 RepID=A0A2P2QKN6_RHIMU
MLKISLSLANYWVYGYICVCLSFWGS